MGVSSSPAALNTEDGRQNVKREVKTQAGSNTEEMDVDRHRDAENGDLKLHTTGSNSCRGM